MQVQQMSADQWQRVRAVRLRALADSPDAFARRLADERALPAEHWQQRLKDTDAATFLAVTEEADVGLAVGSRWDDRENAAGLFSMWVAPEARGQGAGDLLVKSVVAWAAGGGFARLILEVGDDNAPAIRLYERHGFEPTGLTTALPEPRSHIREHERAREL